MCICIPATASWAYTCRANKTCCLKNCKRGLAPTRYPCCRRCPAPKNSNEIVVVSFFKALAHFTTENTTFGSVCLSEQVWIFHFFVFASFACATDSILSLLRSVALSTAKKGRDQKKVSSAPTEKFVHILVSVRIEDKLFCSLSLYT